MRIVTPYLVRNDLNRMENDQEQKEQQYM
jgi:hypothetical protein